MNKKHDWKWYLNNFEAYIAAALFIIICALMFIQVVTRYVFNHAITWTEEMASMLFVVLIYCAIASAVTHRKHIYIGVVLGAVPFKVRKAMMIAGNVFFGAFCVYIIPPFMKVISVLGASKTVLLGVPLKIAYWPVPILLVLITIRIIQNILRLWKEDEENLGKSVPTIDLDAAERDYLESVKVREAAAAKEDKAK